MKVTLVVIGVLLSHAFTVVQSSVSGPRITAEFHTITNDEMVVESSSRFVLTCESNERVEWGLPKLSAHFTATEYNLTQRANWSTVQVGDVYQSRLEVRDAIYLDTGSYVCHHTNDIDFGNSQAEVYVYVEDINNLIAIPEAEELLTVVAYQSRPEIIPCKPTSPSVTMQLLDDNNEILVDSANGKLKEESQPWRYDPRKGFVVEEVVMDMDGFYKCNAISDSGAHRTVDVIVEVQFATASAPKPHINDTLASYVVINKSFQLNCSAPYDIGGLVELKWTVPAGEIDGRRIRTGNPTSHQGHSGEIVKKIAHIVLEVNNVTKQDEGFYTCRATDHSNKSDTATTFVKVHEDGFDYVNISNDGLKFEIEANANETVKWVVSFNAYPQPEIIWFKVGDPDVVIDNMLPKFKLINEMKRTTLEIRTIGGEESGSYKLVIKASEAQDSRQFTLKVRDKPSIKGKSKNVTVGKNERFTFMCEVLAYPEPSVEVYFRPCLPQTQCKDTRHKLFSSNSSAISKSSFKVNEENFAITETGYRSKLVNVTGRANVAGQYFCNACNSLGCAKTSNNQQALVDLAVNELEVEISAIELKKSQQRPPVVGERFTLSCAISLHRYKPSFKWTRTFPNGTSLAINQSLPPQELHFSSSLTNYSYTETWTWPQMPRSANGKYSCYATDLSGQRTSLNAELSVQHGHRPSISNRSADEISIPKYTELYLFCKASGLPTPSVEWFKNDVPMKEGVTDSTDGYDISSELSISYAKPGDSGLYSCRFTNINGTDDAQFNVYVLEPPLSAGIIAGVVIISIVVIVLLGLLMHKIRQDRKRKEFFHAHQLDMFDKGNPESINPDLPVDEQAELLPYDRKWEFPRERLKLGKQLGAGAFGRVVKGDAIGIVPSEPITTVAVKMVRSQGNMLGLKALMSELKIMVHMGSHLNIVNLLGACTKNVTKGELLVIVEYCRFGNIQNFLIKHRSKYINEVDHRGVVVVTPHAPQRLHSIESQMSVETPRSPTRQQFDSADYNGAHAVATDVTLLSDYRSVQVEMNEAFDSAGKESTASSPSKTSGSDDSLPPWGSNYRGDYRDELEKPICTRDLICWAFQIAGGMEYLARRKILHGDLAARNVLLAENNIVKIADFGLAREVYRSGNYKKKGEGPLPVKWMAIESIMDRVFSTQSDVWSFGIVLWELFSLGKTPYPGMEADENFFIKLKHGYRMDKPKYAPSALAEIMYECWHQEPMERPTFTDLADKLGMLLEASVRRHYVELNETYNRTNQNAGSDYLGMMAPVDYVNVGCRTPAEERRDYVNVPQNDESRTSDYLPMERLSPQVISKEKSEAGTPYLFMSSPRPTPEPTPISVGSTGENHFDFNFAPKLRKVEETAVDSVELRPILRTTDSNQSPNQSPTKQPNTKRPNGFSNPNYQNPPTVLCSDLDDPEHYTTPRVLSMNSDPKNYVNVTDHSKIEPYYSQPKSNAIIA